MFNDQCSSNDKPWWGWYFLGARSDNYNNVRISMSHRCHNFRAERTMRNCKTVCCNSIALFKMYFRWHARCQIKTYFVPLRSGFSLSYPDKYIYINTSTSLTYLSMQISTLYVCLALFLFLVSAVPTG